MSVVTRFAPSPTGFLHIGGARTALFNYLFAKHHGGQYLLRIEDTDRERSTPEAVEAIHDGLEWLGLEGDGEAVLQSTRAERHREVAMRLLDGGNAYRCYLTADELDALRKEAHATGGRIASPWRDRDPADAPDAPFTVRLKTPLSGSATIPDAVQGDVTVGHETLDDLVMLRADGTPTYMLAVVVDDHDMGVTHVIRGDDHLNNAFRQRTIIEAMGWPVPVYAHIPLIHGPDGAKLSKRHGALSVTEYRDMGFLPEAVCNYLLRLGWSHGDDEVIAREQAIEWFGLDAVGKSPARFDIDRLDALNGAYIRALPPGELLALVLDILGSPSVPEHIRERLQGLAPAFAERASRLKDLEGLAFAASDDAPAIGEEAAGLLDDAARERLKALAGALPDAFDAPGAFGEWLKDWLDGQGLKMRDIAPPLRAALTGMAQTPDISLIGQCLGPGQMRLRIDAACN